MVAEGLPAQLACRVLQVSESGFYAWRTRAPSPQTLRHAWLTDMINQIHVDFRGVYGYRRVHAELTLGHGITVGPEAVWLLMRKAGLQGISGRPRYRRIPNQPTASDLVERAFAREQPDRLWVTDITEHPTREGKVYCAAVLDVFSRRVVGWSIDSTPTAALVTNALGMAIGQRCPTDSTVIHSDQGTQGEFNRSSQHLDRGGACRWRRCGSGSGRFSCIGGRCRLPSADRCLARGPGPVLGCDRSWGDDRGRGGGGWRVIPRWVPVVPSRWRREPVSCADGVGPLPVVLRTRGHRAAPSKRPGVREIARRVRRDPSTISRELRRNASTRTWRLDYKPSIA
jgi:Integrase core domain/HTH-like domain/Helix-turn-helix domain